MTVKEIKQEIVAFIADAYLHMDEADLQDMLIMLEDTLALVKEEMDRVDRILTE